ncbi:hypothetical protein FJY94_00035 [Candidatus Kaiserbacteria bacterium]|nr:hypothetical protein [Candidatus Kaiserbacteria bacterium]
MLKSQEALKEFPRALSLKKLLGPSFIILALGLGSGEVILWPYLASNYGLGIAWGAILGITFQFFINMEIERYALVKGESVFVGIAKFFRWSVYWFIFSTFIGFGLPGIIAASAKVLASILGIANFKWIAVLMLLIIGVVLSVGKTVYGMMEKITKTVILVGVPFIFILTIVLSSKTDWVALFNGFVGHGNNFWFLPSGIGLATFLAAFAYSGAGGNLNLTQSIYVKEKGYGMGQYSQKIVGLFQSKEKQKIKLTGENFIINNESVSRFKSWWRVINLEHLIVFLFIGSLSMALLMLLSFTTTFGLGGNAEGINFVINEGKVIGQNLFPILGTLFLLVVSIMLFQTQLGIMDSTSRIMAENMAIAKLRKNSNGTINLSSIYYFFVWAQIVFGIILFLCNVYEPKTLIILGAVLNAVAMFVHVGLVAWLNNKHLPKEFRPNLSRKIIISIIFIFFGFFSAIVLLDKLGVLKN